MALTDILERLRAMQASVERNQPVAYIKDIYRCAADEIAFLRREVERLQLRLTIEESRRALNAENTSVRCPHCHWGFHPSVIDQHIREKH